MEHKEPLVDSISTPKILIIEDNPQYVENAVAALKDKYDITVATTRHEALNAFRSQNFDWVLSDLHFPTVNGKKPENQLRFVLTHSLLFNTPLSLVTRGDHHGFDESDPRYVGHWYENHLRFLFVIALTPEDILLRLGRLMHINKLIKADPDYALILERRKIPYRLDSIFSLKGNFSGYDDKTDNFEEFFPSNKVEDKRLSLKIFIFDNKLVKDEEVWQKALDLIKEAVKARKEQNMLSLGSFTSSTKDSGVVLKKVFDEKGRYKIEPCVVPLKRMKNIRG